MLKVLRRNNFLLCQFDFIASPTSNESLLPLLTYGHHSVCSIFFFLSLPIQSLSPNWQ